MVGNGEVVLVHTSPTLHPPFPPTVLYLSCLKVSNSIIVITCRLAVNNTSDTRSCLFSDSSYAFLNLIGLCKKLYICDICALLWLHVCLNVLSYCTYQLTWFKHILFMTEHDKGLGRAKKLCLALSKTHTCTYNLFT